MLFKQAHDQKSFRIENFLPQPLLSVASSISHNLVVNDLDSIDGVKISFDKPIGCPDYMLNLCRPAVLRQHFGARTDNNEVYCYGNGTGSKTVGTHPAYLITREMTSEMKHLGHAISKRMQIIQSETGLIDPQVNMVPLNHCTILFYYYKNDKSTARMLGYHTDNVYDKDGNFLRNKNTQLEDTPTYILTVGAHRDLSFEKQSKIIKGGRKWKRIFTRSIRLVHNSLFVLHPADERPKFFQSLKFRWRHGVLNFLDKNTLSVAFVFRTVEYSTPMYAITSTHLPQHHEKKTMNQARSSHDLLKKLSHQNQKQF
jgi:hypothetical protein